jgi:predicted metal-dependent phosphoesterase TrpH
MDGLAEAIAAGAQQGIEVVPGIELSAEIGFGQCHILGLLIKPDSATLRSRLHEVLNNRRLRNEKILQKMQAHGVAITYEEVETEAGGEVIARPHFAKVLLRKGFVSTMQEAFDKHLTPGGTFYVDRVRLSPAECIDLIHQAGGVAILAHPNNLKRDVEATETKIKELQAAGLDGIEARYNLHTPEDNARYLALARRLGLLTSGGSDFHGPTVKPRVFLGHVEGTKPAPADVLDALKKRRI